MKTKQQNMTKLSSFLLIVFATFSFAQQQRVEGKLSHIEEDGLYKIKIPHSLRSYAKEDMSDFRIRDSKENQVPYFIYKNDKETHVSNFSEFVITSKSNIPDTSSTYIFRNTAKNLQKAVLLVANYQGSKSFNIQGSNDQKEWFGIVNNKQLHNLNSSIHTSVYKVIDFPLCSYQFLKIVFNDQKSLPINLLSIGNATSKITTPFLEIIPVKSTEISELTTTKTTRIHIQFEHPEFINELQLNISSPELFNRKTRVYVLNEREVKHKLETFQKEITNFVIRSDKANHFSIPHFFEKELYIEIENQDNPKLTIESLDFYQNTWYAVAHLKQNETYSTSAGDGKLTAPKYDISYFSSKISENSPKLKMIDVKLIKENKNEKARISIWQKPWFMWLCIGLSTLVIAYFSFKLVKDLKN
jgi:hypothetical protein